MKENKLLKAALMHFKAEKTKGEANLEVYLKNPAGIGEHPDIVNEIVNLTKVIAEADECIKILKTIQEKK